MAHLTLEERSVISSGVIHGETQVEIAKKIGRSPSTVSREMRRNRSSNGQYAAMRAHRISIDRRAQRTITPKLEQPELAQKVHAKLLLNWSPQQISGWLAKTHRKRILSHQTIYAYLWSLPKNHPHRRAMRRRGRRPRKAKPGFIARALKTRVSIHERPKVVNERRRTGDWELDLMTCHRTSGHLITAVERKTGYTLIQKVPSKRSAQVMNRIIGMFDGFHRDLIRTFTFDNGNEFYFHSMLVRSLGVKVYFADPYASGQRGTNENTNGLIRQYFPKTLDYGLISHWDIKRAQKLINERPRLRLGFQTPAAVLAKHPKIAFRI